MYLRVVRRSLDLVIVYDTFIYMIFDILFVLSYFIYFDRMYLSPKIKFTYLLTDCGAQYDRCRESIIIKYYCGKLWEIIAVNHYYY